MLVSNSAINTVLGFNAGQNLSTKGFGNVYIGYTAGSLDNTPALPGDESEVIRIGSVFSGNTACFINGISQTFQPIGDNVFQVTVGTSTGQLSWDFGPNQGSAPQTAARSQRQAMFRGPAAVVTDSDRRLRRPVLKHPVPQDFRLKASEPKPSQTLPSKPCSIAKFTTCR